MIGRSLAQYRIEAELGRGGMGVVYRAHDTRLGRDVAIKVLPFENLGDATARDRQLHEARMASALNHPNIVTLYEAGEAEGRFFISMELVDGKPLGALIPAGGLPVERVARYGAQVADALDHAHARRIVHRDLKTVNVLVTADGRVKTLDFGLAQRIEPTRIEETTRTLASLAEVGEIAGTLPYMAPEQLRGETADARTDIWALGVVLYEMATGTLPFKGKTGFALSSAILNEPPAPLPDHVPPALRAVIQQCLAKEPERRFQRAGELRAALETMHTSTSAASPAVAGSRPRATRRYGGLAIGIVLAAAVGTIALNLGGLRARLFSTKAGAAKIESLAVLPLENLSRDPEQAYFADGMTEALITELSHIGALKVISRTSAMRYKGSGKSAPEAARELGVDALIEGSVLRDGDRVRITVQLIDGASDHHLWAESFDRELRDILALHSEVARSIAEQIEVNLTRQERMQFASDRRVDPKAYELYVLGRYHWNQRTLEHHRLAIDNLRKALKIDPRFAPAHAALADAIMLLGEQGGMPQQEARKLASDEIRQALETGEDLAEVSTTLGFFLHRDWDWSGAERAFRHAIESNPGYAPAHHYYARSLGIEGRFDESLREFRRAEELDPLSMTIRAHLGQSYFFARAYGKAEEEMRKALEIDSNHALLLHVLGELYLALGRFADATAVLERSMDGSREPSAHFAAMLACAHAREGRERDARAALDDLRLRAEKGLASAFDMASVHMALGEKERAIEWLERGYVGHDAWLVELGVWPWFDPLRENPRFQRLIERVRGLGAERASNRSRSCYARPGSIPPLLGGPHGFIRGLRSPDRPHPATFEASFRALFRDELSLAPFSEGWRAPSDGRTARRSGPPRACG